MCTGKMEKMVPGEAPPHLPRKPRFTERDNRGGVEEEHLGRKLYGQIWTCGIGDLVILGMWILLFGNS